MKRWTAALLAAFLLLSLTACQETPPAPEAEDPPAVSAPDAPVSPADPVAPPEVPEEPAEEPVTPPEGEEEGETLRLYLFHTATADTYRSEGGEGAVTLYPTGLTMMSGVAQVDESMNAYYKNVFDKLKEFCWGELMELSEDGKFHYSVTVDAELARLNSEMISVSRTVTVDGDDTGLHTVTYYGETFDCATGGLLTADDFFSVPEDEYTQRLVECVRRKISEDPYHDQNYFAQWEDLTASAFQKENFYVTDEAYVVFYQENELGPDASLFEIPWSQLEDIAA